MSRLVSYDAREVHAAQLSEADREFWVARP
jgi:hypothetical protein